MPRYFLHIHNGLGSARDDERQELADLEEARAKAVEGIRSLLAGEVVDGTIDFRGYIEIMDECGRCLAVVPFGDAVTVRPAEDAA